MSENNELSLVNKENQLNNKNVFASLLDKFKKKEKKSIIKSEQNNNFDIDFILDILDRKIRNESFSSFITNEIHSLRLRKGKILLNSNQIMILEKNEIDYFKIVVTPSFEDFNEITVTKVQWEGHETEIRKLIFKDNYIFMDRCVETKMRRTDSDNIIGIRLFQDLNIYLDNELIFNYNLMKDDCDEIDIKESEIYILKNKMGYQREHFVKGIKETFAFNKSPFVHEMPFNTKDIQEKVFGYSTTTGTFEEYVAFLKIFKSEILPIQDLSILKLKSKTDI